MSMRFYKVAVFILLLMLCALNALPAASEAPAKPAVEGNILVTTDIAMPHTESDEAVNPRNPLNIAGATEVLGSRNGPPFVKSYVSLDGGYTWKDTTPAGCVDGNSGDPRIIFTNRGSALLITLNLDNHTTDVYRSIDDGMTWSKPFRFALFDHEMVAVDRSSGPHSNRVYIAGEGGREIPHPLAGMGEERQIWLYTSDDDGRTFIRRSIPETGVNIPKSDPFYEGGVAVGGLTVLSDGSVALSTQRYNQLRVNYERNAVAISTNGGDTFRPERHVLDFYMFKEYKKAETDAFKEMRAGNPTGAGEIISFTAARGGPQRDRLYTVWADRHTAKYRILYSYSDDRGATWRAPQPVGSVDPTEAQFMPRVAVNNEGVVLITWFSSAGFPKRDHFNAYAAMSEDGGKTFSAPVRVTTATSYPHTVGNMMPVPVAYVDRHYHTRSQSFISGYSRWDAGGDYLGLDSGSDGVFHYYWPDSRGAEYEMYAARIHARPVVASDATEHDVSSDVWAYFDPISIDPASSEVDIPIRLQNVSTKTLYGPITVTFGGTKVLHDYGVKQQDVGVEILNANNGKRGVGAMFDYSNTLGSYGALRPHAISNPIVWRFRLSDIDNLSPIDLHLNIRARSD